MHLCGQERSSCTRFPWGGGETSTNPAPGSAPSSAGHSVQARKGCCNIISGLIQSYSLSSLFGHRVSKNLQKVKSHSITSRGMVVVVVLHHHHHCCCCCSSCCCCCCYEPPLLNDHACRAIWRRVALSVSFRGPLVTPRGLQGHALSTVTVPTHSGHSHFSRHCSSESVWLEPKPSAA